MKLNEFKFRDIVSTEDIKIGDIMVYVKPDYWLYPDIGSLWAMNSENDLMAMSIRLVESRQIWRPLVNPEDFEHIRHQIDCCKPLNEEDEKVVQPKRILRGSDAVQATDAS